MQCPCPVDHCIGRGAGWFAPTVQRQITTEVGIATPDNAAEQRASNNVELCAPEVQPQQHGVCAPLVPPSGPPGLAALPAAQQQTGGRAYDRAASDDDSIWYRARVSAIDAAASTLCMCRCVICSMFDHAFANLRTQDSTWRTCSPAATSIWWRPALSSSCSSCRRPRKYLRTAAQLMSMQIWTSVLRS